uniref:Uncharacterized protein n=1 Tax=Anopheles maculatus TaxID=74869 RepID=A0A182S7N3_9DIPT
MLAADVVYGEECGPNEFECEDGTCIDLRQQCDNVPDCRRGEDEQDCVECDESREFFCRVDKVCIPKEAVCDGRNDCSDAEDEICEACPRNTWQCDYGQCIPLEQKCDGNIDCPDDISDERNCPSKHQPGGRFDVGFGVGIAVGDVLSLALH